MVLTDARDASSVVCRIVSVAVAVSVAINVPVAFKARREGKREVM
jgi:hypothetical protein